MTAWNLNRCIEVRKRSAGGSFALVPLFVGYKWMTRKHYSACNNLIYDVAIIVALGNDVLGVVEKESQLSIGIEPTKIVSVDEAVQCHNEKWNASERILKSWIETQEGSWRRWRLALLAFFYGSAIID